ncbi:Tar ligand binding domain-containing protein [Escherichia coli]|nr:Tar ligand binding domain-containing protein [Escherichia coli]
MFNRIRISTTLFLILILCGILQIGSNGMSFWAFRDDLQRLNQVEQSNQQRAALAQTRAVMLQASTALNKAGTLTALSYPADDIKTLMTTARASLTQSTTLFKSFMAMTAGNGAAGMLAMRQAGAWTLAQNEASCVVFGMPREAINMGGVCEVVDLSQVSQQMLAKISAGQAIRI